MQDSGGVIDIIDHIHETDDGRNPPADAGEAL